MNTPAEQIFHGVGASPGIVMGNAYVFTKNLPRIEERIVSEEEVATEIERLDHAVSRSERELQKILQLTEEKIGVHKAKIFEAQIMILADQILLKAIRKRIQKDRKNSEYVVHTEISKYQQMMLNSPDEYMRERAHDVEDVKNRIIRNIQQERLISRFENNSIVVSDILTPADTVLFSRNEVLAYVTDMGGTTSHSALLARSMKIPSVVGMKIISKHIQSGDYLIVDGYSGTVIQNPAKATIKRYKELREEHRQFDLELTKIRDEEAITLDGKTVELSCNIEFAEEGSFMSEQGGHGIGLYRTEGLFMREDDYPSEEVQEREYIDIVKCAAPNKTVMRTLDVGGDKFISGTMEEENPFLGWRGIRISLSHPEIFLVQIRAILRASVRGKIWIMLPMVSGLKEIRLAKELIERAKKELRIAGVPFDEEIKVGAMIEVPSAAVIAGDIAEEVDFLSIGTNDLIQYLIAVDRGNDVVSYLYQEFHPAVVKTIAHIVDEGHKHGKPVAMCGEMAGDPIATLLLLGLGLDEFSVSPIVLPEIKKIIRSVSFHEVEEIAQKCLQMKTEEEIKEFLRINLQTMVPDLLLPE